jgi:hypothetical protein
VLVISTTINKVHQEILEPAGTCSCDGTVLLELAGGPVVAAVGKRRARGGRVGSRGVTAGGGPPQASTAASGGRWFGVGGRYMNCGAWFEVWAAWVRALWIGFANLQVYDGLD